MTANCRPTLHLQKPRQRSGRAGVLPIRPGLKVFSGRQAQPLPLQEKEVGSNALRDLSAHASGYNKTASAPAAQPTKRIRRRTKYGFM